MSFLLPLVHLVLLVVLVVLLVLLVLLGLLGLLRITEQEQARVRNAGGRPDGPGFASLRVTGTPIGETAVTNNASVVQDGTTPCRLS